MSAYDDLPLGYDDGLLGNDDTFFGHYPMWHNDTWWNVPMGSASDDIAAIDATIPAGAIVIVRYASDVYSAISSRENSYPWCSRVDHSRAYHGGGT